MAFLDILNQTQTLLGPLSTFIGGLSGTVQDRRGSKLQAKGFRDSGAAGLQAANFNNQLTDINLSREADALSRSLKRISSTQLTQAAASGIDITSPSVLAVMNETVNQFEREIVDRQVAAENQKRVELFSAQVGQATQENKARAVEFGAEQRVRESIPSLLSQGAAVFKAGQKVLEKKT